MSSPDDNNLLTPMPTPVKMKPLRKIQKSPPKPDPSEETPITLPFPPRREDEPESDPFAETVPVISSVQSLHVPPPAGVRIPQGIRLGIVEKPSTPIRTTPPQPLKPKITIKTTAELAAKNHPQVRTQLIANTPGKTSTIELEMRPDENGQMVLTSPAAPHGPKVRLTPVEVNEPTTGKSFVLPIPNFSVTPDRPLVVRGENNKLMILTNIAKVNNQTTGTPGQVKLITNAGISTPILQHGSVSKPIPSPATQATVVSKPTTTTPFRTPQLVPISTPRQPAVPQAKAAAQPSTQPPVHVIKEALEAARKRTRIYQKKVDFLQLRVSTYETLVSQLSRKRIISKQSAKELKVLDEDVTRYQERLSKRGTDNTGYSVNEAGLEKTSQNGIGASKTVM